MRRIKKEIQLGDYKLMQYQILQTNIIRIVWQTVRRITREILEVKGWKKPQVGCDLNCNRFLPFFLLTILFRNYRKLHKRMGKNQALFLTYSIIFLTRVMGAFDIGVTSWINSPLNTVAMSA